jgi:hypothetical protein
MSMLFAGILTKNKTWIILGLVYMIPFILIFSIPVKETEDDFVLVTKNMLLDTIPLIKSETIKYQKSIYTKNQFIKFEKQYDSIAVLGYGIDTVQINKIYDARDSLENLFDTEILREGKFKKAKNTKYEDFVYTLWVIFTLAAFINSLLIIKKYRLIVGGFVTTEVKINRTFVAENQKVKELSEEEKIIEETNVLKKRILAIVKNSEDENLLIDKDILKMTEAFTQNIKKLIEEKKQLEEKIKISGLETLQKELEEINQKLVKESNPRVIKELKNSIDIKTSLLESENEILTTYKTIQYRIDNAVDSLKQIENDLIKLDNVLNVDNKENFFKTFDEKSDELTNYANDVEKNIKEL